MLKAWYNSLRLQRHFDQRYDPTQELSIHVSQIDDPTETMTSDTTYTNALSIRQKNFNFQAKNSVYSFSKKYLEKLHFDSCAEACKQKTWPNLANHQACCTFGNMMVILLLQQERSVTYLLSKGREAQLIPIKKKARYETENNSTKTKSRSRTVIVPITFWTSDKLK